MAKFHQGKFRPLNPEKYKGDVSNIIYRSSWELSVMQFFDRNNSITNWCSEELTVSYRSKIDGSLHRYFPDFLIKTKDGRIVMIEVKPFKQTQPPKIPARKTKRFLKEVEEYGKNLSKWEAAEKYCKERGWEFQILTENEIYG